MNNEAIFKLSYGLYVLSVRENGKDNACVVNTVMQAALEPNTLCVCVNKANYTHDMLMRTKKLAVSVLNKNTDFELIKRFGFQSGRDADKFNEFGECERLPSGVLYVTKNTNAYISATTDKTIDLGSHTMFLGKISDAEVLNDVPSLTYEHYLNNIKPKPEKAVTGKIVWRCKICGYEYDGEELPPDYVCPLCKHPASDFEKAVF